MQSTDQLESIPVDEKSLRSASFREGQWVELADGNRWSLPPVLLRIFPQEKDDGTVDVLCRPWYADDMEPLVDTLFGVTATGEDPGFMESWQARLTIAMRLLKSNYDLPPGMASRLLSYVPGDPASERRWSKIRPAMLGRDPDAADEDESPKGDAGTSGG